MTAQLKAEQDRPAAEQMNRLFPDTIRFLAADAVERAGSGHPGAPMGTADWAYVLWDRLLKFNPRNPRWPDRDRYVLSAGHSCLLLYSLLHLYGYDVSLDDLRSYRQWGSRTPGHPEFGHTPGVETTTGPLGQGLGNAVGMALAERFLAARFNRDPLRIVDHHTYCHCSDGDLMEGVASEAASLAGHLKLGKLIVIYDDNKITIGGTTAISFTEDVAGRFTAYGWHCQKIDGHDHPAIHQALERARAETERPSLILARTHIGYGSPHLQDTPAVHGSPLGAEELKLTKQNLNWPADPAFFVPAEVYAHARAAARRGEQEEEAWRKRLTAYRDRYPDEADEFQRWQERGLPAGWDVDLPVFTEPNGSVATRSASGQMLNALASRFPELVGGSADLEPSNKTLLKGEADQSAAEPLGRNIHFGVREHGMGAVCNGIAYHGGLRPYCGTFLVFSDYQRPAVRIAALANLPVVFIYTHDSIGVGGDGPTHQPIEHLQSLRAIPNLTVIRPADANETRTAWQVALKQAGPVVLILTRQNVPVIPNLAVENTERGAYIAREAPGKTPSAIILATGSELTLALDAAGQLADDGIPVRVVNFPSVELFASQPAEYRDMILPPQITRRLAVEAGSPDGWWRWVGATGDVLGLNRFGASAPGSRLFTELGFTATHIAERVRALY